MPYYSRRTRRQRNPFPVIPLIAVAIVLGAAAFLVSTLWPRSSAVPPSATAAAQFLLLNGQARITLSGGIETTVGPSQTPNQLNAGEAVEALGTTRLDVFFQNGASVKLDGNSALRVVSAQGSGGADRTVIEVTKGNAWVRTLGTPGATITVRGRTSEVNVGDASMAAVTRNAFADIYRGIQGGSVVRVLDTDGSTVLSEAALALGQQMTLTDAVVADLRARKPIQLAQLFDPDFRTSEWYAANMGSAAPSAMPATNGNLNVNASVPGSGSANGPTVNIVTPTQGATLSAPTITISGTVSSTAAKVVVNDYVLQKYVPGSPNWSYLASSGNGNLLKGDNVFTVYAIDAQGNRGETATVSFSYQGSGAASDGSGTTTGKLAAPVISGPKTLTTGETKLIITGTVGENATKVVVNGFVLQKYVPGSKTFSYTASIDLGTMKEGVNVYTVYAVDKQGNKSPASTVQITYKKGAATGSGATR